MSVPELFTGIIKRVDRGQSRVVMCLFRALSNREGKPSFCPSPLDRHLM